MKQIEDYTQEELVALYKRMTLYCTTWWFKYYKTYDKYYNKYKQKKNNEDEPVILWHFDSLKELNPHKNDLWLAEQEHWVLGLSRNVVNTKIDSLMNGVQNENTRREIKKLTYQRTAIEIMDLCVYWFAGLYDYYVEEYDNLNYPERWMSPEEREEELHMNDEDYIRQGLATDYQVYEFVWETLQYLSIPQLTKLLKFADQGVSKKWETISETRGRKSRKCEIRQIDIETGDVVNTYTTRNELISKTGIKKSHLAQCIKTAKENPGRRDEWKKWIGEDNRKYGFIEFQ